MPRRSFDNLSAAYQRRLERGGISRSAYESGASLSAARGHKATPEHPTDAARNPGKYREYEEKKSLPQGKLNDTDRAQLERKVLERAHSFFADTKGFNHDRVVNNIRGKVKEGKMKRAIPRASDAMLRKMVVMSKEDWQSHAAASSHRKHSPFHYH